MSGVKVSVTELAGEHKSRLVKKGFFLLVLLPAGCYLLAGAGYLTQSIFDYWFCYHCKNFNEERFSIFWFIGAHLLWIGGYMAYKWSKKNEAIQAQKEALEKAGKVAMGERFLEDGEISTQELEEIREAFQIRGTKPTANPGRDDRLNLTKNVDPVIQNPDAYANLLSRLEELENNSEI